MNEKKQNACIYGFEPGLRNSLKEILYFAGFTNPYDVEDVSGLSRIFKTDIPDIVVISLQALDELDFHIMIGSNPQFDRMVIITGVDDVESPNLRHAIETCAMDFFLISKPYHLKRQAMAVMALNPWEEIPAMGGKIFLADPNLERRIAVARSLRIARFDVDFAVETSEIEEKVRGEHPYRVVICSEALGEENLVTIIKKISCDVEARQVPWIVYGEGKISLFKPQSGKIQEEARHTSTEFSPETIVFHVQNLLSPHIKEMRKSERIPYFTPVKVILERLNEEMWGFSSDLSENGLYIRTLVPPPPETMVTISFKPPTAEGMVKMGARVAWRKEYGSKGSPSKHPGFGVEFVRISEPDKAAVQAGYNILAQTLKKCSISND